MKNKSRIFWFLVPVIVGMLSMSMGYIAIADSDYKNAISIGEKEFESFNIKRDAYKLIKIENDIIKNNGEVWTLTYLTKECIAPEGIRNCLGGEVFITVNLKTEKAKVRWGE